MNKSTGCLVASSFIWLPVLIGFLFGLKAGASVAMFLLTMGPPIILVVFIAWVIRRAFVKRKDIAAMTSEEKTDVVKGLGSDLKEFAKQALIHISMFR